MFLKFWQNLFGERRTRLGNGSVHRWRPGALRVVAGFMTLFLMFAGIGLAKQPTSAANPNDGMSAIDIAVAAAQDKSRQPPPRSAEKAVRDGAVILYSFALVEMQMNSLHPGWSPIPGEPLPGPVTAEAVLLGTWQTAEFRLLDESNKLLRAVTLSRSDEDPSGSQLTGTFELPTQPFKVAVSGVDTSSAAYDIIWPVVHRPQTVELRFAAGFTQAGPGPALLDLAVTNHGPAQAFDLTVSNDMGQGVTIAPARLTLAPGETQNAQVTLGVPAISSGVLDITVTATATGATQSAANNFATTNVRIQRLNLLFEDNFEPAQSSAGAP